MDPVNLSPQGFEGRRRGAVGGPVRTVDDDRDALQIDWTPEAIDQVCYVRFNERLLDCHPADACASGPGPLFNQTGFDGVFERVVELVPPTRKELDSVVGHRVVAGRQHDAEISVTVLSEKRDSGSRQHAEPYHIDASAG
jgi:hypothetical protein